MANLRREIEQGQPFSSLEEEAVLNVFRTADCLQREFQRRTRDWGISSTQYNVLRILRGAHPESLTCTEIGSRMITADPDITRLLARMTANKLIKQHRDHHDRRVVRTQIAEAGMELLRQMDPLIQRIPKDLLGHLGEKEIAQLIGLLEVARESCGEARRNATCDGNEKCETANQ